jgi:1-acyl-sn-glycerol-3-phosphate acyltransferase
VVLVPQLLQHQFMKTSGERFAGRFYGLYAYPAMVLGLGALLHICVLGLPVALVLLCLPRSIRVPLGRRLISFGLSVYLLFLRAFCGVRLDAAALSALRADRPLIIVANHPSLLDAVILLASLPKAACVMKGSLRRNWLFGPMARLSGYVGNEEPMSMIRQACDELARGAHLLIFPEGTRTTSFPVNAFSQATAFIAARSQVHVQTVLLDFSQPYLGKAWPIFKKPPLPLRISVRIGQKFAPEMGKSAMTERLESYFRLQLAGENRRTGAKAGSESE